PVLSASQGVLRLLSIDAFGIACSRRPARWSIRPARTIPRVRWAISTRSCSASPAFRFVSLSLSLARARATPFRALAGSLRNDAACNRWAPQCGRTLLYFKEHGARIRRWFVWGLVLGI